MSSIQSFRPIVPSESLIEFCTYAGKTLKEVEFENNNPLLEPRVYAINSLRVTLIERRARAGQDVGDLLAKLHVVMAQQKITTTGRRRSHPGAFKNTTKRTKNPIIKALSDAEEFYLHDGEEEDGKGKILLRAATIIDSTEDDFRENG